MEWAQKKLCHVAEEQGQNRPQGNLWLNKARGPIRLNKGVSLEDSSDND